MPLGFDHERGELIRETQDSLAEGIEEISKAGEQLAELKQALLKGADHKYSCLEDLAEAVAHIEAIHEEAIGHLKRAKKVSELLSGDFSQHEVVASQFENAAVSPGDCLKGRWAGILAYYKLVPKEVSHSQDAEDYPHGTAFDVTPIETFGQLVCYSKDEVWRKGNPITPKALQDLEQYLAEQGLHLRQD